MSKPVACVRRQIEPGKQLLDLVLNLGRAHTVETAVVFQLFTVDELVVDGWWFGLQDGLRRITKYSINRRILLAAILCPNS